MTETVDPVYWIWFQLLFGTGTRRAELMMDYFDNPKQIYDGISAKNRVTGMMTEDELAASETAMVRADEIKRRTLRKGVAIVTPDSAEYPELLRQIYSKPAVLYVKGDLCCLDRRLAIAIVGSRKHTEYGTKAARFISQGLVRGDAVVVSGLAPGIDTVGHTAALDAGGKSIGVLGCGIDVDYPKGSSGLKRRMCENGAVITEFPLGTEPLPGHFPIRNRIISGLSHGVVVVEADIRSGSLLTASHAKDQGRDIFAIPGSIFSSRSKGAHELINDGAKPATHAQDIFDEYRNIGLWKNVGGTYIPEDDGATIDKGEKTKKPQKPSAKPERQKLPDGVEADVEKVYNAIGETLLTASEIAERADMDMPSTLSALTELEIYGLIQLHPGRKFGIRFALDA